MEIISRRKEDFKVGWKSSCASGVRCCLKGARVIQAEWSVHFESYPNSIEGINMWTNTWKKVPTITILNIDGDGVE